MRLATYFVGIFKSILEFLIGYILLGGVWVCSLSLSPCESGYVVPCNVINLFFFLILALIYFPELIKMTFHLKNIKGFQNHQAHQDPSPNHKDHKDESHQQKKINQQNRSPCRTGKKSWPLLLVTG